MEQCKAFKNKKEQIQCLIKIKNKNSFYCGKHRNTNTPVFDSMGNVISNAIYNAIDKQEQDKQEQKQEQEKEKEKEKEKEQENSIIELKKNSKFNYYKSLVNSVIYNEYLTQRKNYIKDNSKDNNKYIELIEYIENSKLDYYPNSRILASLEYYKLIKKQDVSKFILAINNINLLVSLFETLLNVNVNLNKIIKLQKWIKKSLIKFKNKLHGPALTSRKLCVNDSDFVSLDDLKDISNVEFISFKDDTGFIYGFHIDSIAELIFKSDENYYENFKKHSSNLCYKQFIKTLFNHYNKIKIFNPYTRFTINGTIKQNILRLYAMNKYNLNHSNAAQHNTRQNGHSIIDTKITISNKCFSIFQKIDMLGYFTDTSWLLDEHIKNIKIFYKKLASLWNFEFGLNNTARFKITKQHNLFQNLHDIMISRGDKYTILDKILDIINILVSNGETEGDKNTGCILVLYGLAFINYRCIQANPWLG